MKYRSFRDTGINISLLGLGCMRFPRLKGSELIDYEKAEAIIDHAYANGVNYFDSAYVYNNGDSERVTGKALSKYPRDSFMLATKMPGHKPKCEQDVYDIFNEQLERCGVDYFDFYLCHNLNDSTYDVFTNDYLIKALESIKAQGKIRYLGFSSHAKPDMLEKFASLRDWDFAQIQFNYLDWTYQDAKRQYEILNSRGIPIVVMEPVRGGRLASLSPEIDTKLKAYSPDKSIASWALRWAASHSGVLTVLSGMNAIEQVVDNIETMSNHEPLNADEQTIIDAAVSELLAKTLAPCTGCRYCIECPVGIDIPAMIEVYNDFTLSSNPFALMPISRQPAGKTPADCVDCGTCESLCPQSIMISDIMESLTASLNKAPPQRR